ncbi:MAG: hypothetical protein JXA43_02415 [Candidatus Diapherotrites archaeon]|nr:hypothetical protein [Candidatus Diapherotrites archaeon]
MTADILNNPDKIMFSIMEQTGKAESEIRGLIKKKIDAFGGMLTEAGAAYSVANDLGVKMGTNAPKRKRLKLSDLEEGMENVDVVVSVKQVFAPQTFEKENKKGRVCSVIVTDGAEEARLSLWHDDVDLVEQGKIASGTTLLLEGAYVKLYNEQKQLSVTSKGNIVINPEGENIKVPKIEVSMKKIKEIKVGNADVNLIGKITWMGTLRTFQRDGQPGKVANIELVDGTGKIRVALWGEHTNLLTRANVGDVIQINGGYAREGLNNAEVNVGWRGTLIVNPQTDLAKELENVRAEGLEKFRIDKLDDGISGEINGMVVHIYDNRSFNSCPKCNGKTEGTVCPKCGNVEPVSKMILPFELDDGFGCIRCVAFGVQAQKILGIEKNDVNADIKLKSTGKKIAITGTARKDEFSGGLSFTCRNLVSDKIDALKETNEVLERISE